MVGGMRQFVAPPGRWLFSLGLAVAIGAFYWHAWWIVAAALALGTLGAWVFRDPNREVPPEPLGVVAPVDGRVTNIVSEQNAHLETNVTRMVMHRRILGAYTLRSPVEGQLVDVWSQKGDRTGPDCTDAVALRMRTDEGDDCLLVIHRGFANFSGDFPFSVGDRIGQGQRCGHPGVGACIEVVVPTSAKLRVGPRARVHAGSTLLATFSYR